MYGRWVFMPTSLQQYCQKPVRRPAGERAVAPPIGTARSNMAATVVNRSLLQYIFPADGERERLHTESVLHVGRFRIGILGSRSSPAIAVSAAARMQGTGLDTVSLRFVFDCVNYARAVDGRSEYHQTNTG